MPPPPTRRNSGQAAVELICVLPLLAAVLALAWQLIVAGHAAWAVATAARAAARAAAVGADPASAARAHLPQALESGLRVIDRQAGAVEVSVEVPRILAGLSVGRVASTSRFRPQDGDAR
jgi:Flp pilus assembly protein TadG